MSEDWQVEISTVVQRATEVLQEKKRLLEERIKEQQEKEAEMERQIERKRVETQAQLEQQRLELEAEKKTMENVHKFQSNQVTLDVGGKRFKTSLSTLRKEPNTMLAAMFSGRHELTPDEDGSYFIDRDGTHFCFVLDFLRDGDDACLPKKKDVLERLLREADFYQIERLSSSIGKLLKPQLSQKDVEIKLRLRPFTSNFVSENGQTMTSSSIAINTSFDYCVINDVTLSGVYFQGPCSFHRANLRNVSFSRCYFGVSADFSAAEMTNVSFRDCGNILASIMIGASRDGVTFDVAGLKEKHLF